ncbi:RES domain-containing protein [Leptobacterium flavescens]|uniref:RES domain-containing protein n=1 Tax=Leptobacterium flavescens TaxID=472055 RepID=A0A6P0UHR4_9FLAO|nr:RES family NAD+ phosphorylase [Leptobacterium flavescens]NER12784.1 RES domain-containing protein [Leptobacterium flavescens]
MIVYRIDRNKRKNDLLSGIGAEKVGGRWNKIGTRAVYTSENVSLCYLEIVMHLDISEDLPDDRILVHIEIPDEIEISEEKKLPKNWNSFPYNSGTQEIFTKFCNERKGAVLKVPSAIVGSEYNFVINPLHPDAAKIKIVKIEKFSFDKRLKK